MENNPTNNIRWWHPVLFAAMAGGMAWGIRGQYGHETGAMIAGLLVGLTLTLLLCPHVAPRKVVRAVAWCTVAMGVGGSMTYGQTVGLTHNAPMIGHWQALRWGMLGLAIKGGIWIGFAGVFLGMGLGGVRYRPLEMLALMIAALVAFFVGESVLNAPFDPANKALPAIYFSAHWHWEPDSVLKPRPECWGGLLLALAAVTAYAGGWRKDRLARNLAHWGILGGAIGFPAGQSLQAFHAWNPEFFQQGFLWPRLDPYMNWWNMMETTFGAIMGGTLGLGLWLNRNNIQPHTEPDTQSMPSPIEWVLLAIHLPLLIAVEFSNLSAVDAIYDLGLIMIVVPVVAIAGGRRWPYLVVFPITLLPIAGKTVLQLVYSESSIPVVPGWIIYFIVPLSFAIAAAIWFGRQPETERTTRDFTRRSLLLATWMYFLLNYAFFHFPWPWVDWTGRTPNGVIFTVFALGLTAAALLFGRSEPSVSEQEPATPPS